MSQLIAHFIGFVAVSYLFLFYFGLRMGMRLAGRANLSFPYGLKNAGWLVFIARQIFFGALISLAGLMASPVFLTGTTEPSVLATSAGFVTICLAFALAPSIQATLRGLPFLHVPDPAASKREWSQWAYNQGAWCFFWLIVSFLVANKSKNSVQDGPFSEPIIGSLMPSTLLFLG